MFLSVSEKQNEGSQIELVRIFKSEILANYYSLLYEFRKQLVSKPMKMLFTKVEFLLPATQGQLDKVRKEYKTHVDSIE